MLPYLVWKHVEIYGYLAYSKDTRTADAVLYDLEVCFAHFSLIMLDRRSTDLFYICREKGEIAAYLFV